jgi:hypothetical protein
MRFIEFALVERDQLSIGAARWGQHRAKQVPQQFAGGVVIAIVDERRPGRGAGGAGMLGHHGMPGRLVRYEHGTGTEERVLLRQRLHDPRHDGAVLCAREEPNAGRREIGERVDAFFALEALGVALARCRRAGHALIPSAP